MIKRPLVKTRKLNNTQLPMSKLSVAMLPVTMLPVAIPVAMLSMLSPLSQANAEDIKSDRKVGLEHVVVSASRGPEKPSDLAGNISLIDEQTLEQVKAVHINEVSSRSPGTWISRGNGQEHLTAIRSPVLSGAGACGAFIMAQDGIALRGTGFCNANQLFESVYELASGIEIIRGPAGVFYGSGAMHGTINVLTPTPENSNVTRVGLEGGPHDYQRLQIKKNLRIDDNNRWLFGFNGSKDGGYKDDSGFAQQKVLVKNRRISANSTIDSVITASNLNQETATYIKGDEGIYKDKDLKPLNDTPEGFRDAQSFKAYSRIDTTLHDGSHFVFTPYVRHSDMAFQMHWLSWSPTEENQHQSIGFQSVLHSVNRTRDAKGKSKGSGYYWSSGFDLEYTQGELQQTQYGPTNSLFGVKPQGKQFDFDVNAVVASTFAQVTSLISTQSEFVIGTRFEHTLYDYDNHLSDGSVCAPEIDNCLYTRPSDSKESFGDWSTNVAFKHQLNPETHAWIKASRGFRAPQATELFRLEAGQTSAPITSEELNAVEFGVRHQSQLLAFEAIGFSMDKENVIYKSDNLVANDSATEHFGFELAMQIALSAQVTLRANTTLASHEYTNNVLGEGTEGNAVQTAPEEISAVQVQWQPISSLNTELEWVHMGAYYLDPQNEHQYPGHDIYNLRTQYTFSQGFDLSLNIINLVDEDYAERADYNYGTYRYFVGEPRSVYVGVSYQF
jgi:outer membrane receptor protein involved in Fe transport